MWVIVLFAEIIHNLGLWKPMRRKIIILDYYIFSKIYLV